MIAHEAGKTRPIAGRSLYLETVGCQMNVLDSELVWSALRDQGYERTDDIRKADTILFNTCSVRQHAEDKIYSALGRLKRRKRDQPELVVGVLGCMAQKDQAEIFQRAPHVDLICSPGQLAKIPQLIEEARRARKPQQALGLNRNQGARLNVLRSFESYDPMRAPRAEANSTQAYVRVMMGCDKFCTYCIVPTVRGPEQSRPPDAIVGEAKRLVDDGCKEITLLGQTVNSYRYKHGDDRITRLSDLLSAMHDLTGLARIKFVTNYPKDMSTDLLEAVRDLPKVSPYFHVPAQSGCDRVLAAMKRGYTADQYRETLARIREFVPGAAVSSDFIVGFPGETEESFEKTVELVREARFKNSFIFKYSPRKGTVAFKTTDDVPQEVKRRRNRLLLEVQTANSLEDGLAQIGKLEEVLVEGPSKLSQKDPDAAAAPHRQMTGRTSADRIVVFEGWEGQIGRLLPVRIVDATPYALLGEVVVHELVGLAFPGDNDESSSIL